MKLFRSWEATLESPSRPFVPAATWRQKRPSKTRLDLGLTTLFALISLIGALVAFRFDWAIGFTALATFLYWRLQISLFLPVRELDVLLDYPRRAYWHPMRVEMWANGRYVGKDLGVVTVCDDVLIFEGLQTHFNLALCALKEINRLKLLYKYTDPKTLDLKWAIGPDEGMVRLRPNRSTASPFNNTPSWLTNDFRPWIYRTVRDQRSVPPPLVRPRG